MIRQSPNESKPEKVNNYRRFDLILGHFKQIMNSKRRLGHKLRHNSHQMELWIKYHHSKIIWRIAIPFIMIN